MPSALTAASFEPTEPSAEDDFELVLVVLDEDDLLESVVDVELDEPVLEIVSVPVELDAETVLSSAELLSPTPVAPVALEAPAVPVAAPELPVVVVAPVAPVASVVVVVAEPVAVEPVVVVTAGAVVSVVAWP